MNILAVTVLLDDPSGGPSTPAGALQWRDQYGLQSVYVLSDPGFQMVPGSSVGTPQFTVVDPRTMQVHLVQEGFSGGAPPILGQIAAQNAAL